jgi:hypothetical protein
MAKSKKEKGAVVRIEDPQRFPNHSIPVVGPEVGGVDSDWAKRNLQSDREIIPKFGKLNKAQGDPELELRLQGSALNLQPYQPLTGMLARGK